MRGRKGGKGAKKRGGRGGPCKRGKKEKGKKDARKQVRLLCQVTKATEISRKCRKVSLKFRRATPSEGHNPLRGSPRKFASQRVLRGLCVLFCFEGSAGVRGPLRGFTGFSEATDPTPATLRNCRKESEDVTKFRKMSSSVVLAVPAVPFQISPSELK